MCVVCIRVYKDFIKISFKLTLLIRTLTENGLFETMHKFPIADYKKFSELPFDQFNKLKFSIYIIDFNWNYLFVNEFVERNLGAKGSNLIGKNMWEEFKELATDPSFILLKKNSEKRLTTNI